MRLTSIALVLCACLWLSAGDVAHLKSKAKLLGRLASKHNKRGVLSSVPPFKLGHDIPLVTHSVVKPLVVTYPPTAAVTAVKVPLAHPLLHRYPVGVGHRVPVPHPHYGLKFPHHTKAVLSDQHFHHHHHHVAPRPLVPVVPAPTVPIPAPTIARPLPVPSPAVVVPTALVPQPHSPPIHPPDVHLRPIFPAPPVLPAAPAPAPVVAPSFSFAPQYPYILRPGGAVQSSVFATYPRYPFGGFQPPMFPLSASAFTQIVPHAPQFLVPQGEPQEGVVVGHRTPVPVEPTPTLLHEHGELPQSAVYPGHGGPGVHFHPAQSELPLQPAFHLHPEQPDFHLHPVQPGVHLHSAQPDFQLQPGVHVQAQPDVHLQPVQPEYHLSPGHTDVHLQPAQPEYHFQPGQPDVHLQPAQPDFHFQPGHPDAHLHPAQPEFHIQPGQTDVHLQPQPDYNLQPGGQPDYHLQPQPTQPTVDNQGWSPVPAHPADVGNNDLHYPNDGQHHFTQEQGNQVFEQHSGDSQYNDYQNQLQHHIQQQIEQHQLAQAQGQGQGQGGQDFNYQHPAAEYGPPGAEGRSADGDGDQPQLYHNHIPLGLQPPIDRPLEHFR